MTPKPGDLCVWWIPQVPMKAFHIPVKNIDEAKLVLKVLGNYDIFQLDNNIKPDYSNAGGLNVYTLDIDGEGTPGWEEWHNDEGDDIDEVMEDEP